MARFPRNHPPQISDQREADESEDDPAKYVLRFFQPVSEPPPAFDQEIVYWLDCSVRIDGLTLTRLSPRALPINLTWILHPYPRGHRMGCERLPISDGARHFSQRFSPLRIYIDNRCPSLEVIDTQG